MKYVLNVELYTGQVYVVKFYCHRDRKKQNKYSILTNSGEAITILRTISGVVPQILSVYSEASFGFMGASAVSRSGRYTESFDQNQRFVVYRQLVQRWVGVKNLRHIEIPKASSYLLISRKRNIYKEKERIIKMMLKTYPNLHELMTS